MAFFDEFTKKAKDVAYLAADKAKDAAEPVSYTHLDVYKRQDFQLLERDALRFAADRPYRFENMTNSTARLLLSYRYLK